MFEVINKHKYLELLEVGETDELEFRIVIAEAQIIENSKRVASKEEPNDKIRQLLNESKPIKVTGESKKFEIIFESYITYSVTNESYAKYVESDRFEGGIARIYTKSVFLEYVSKSTFATSEYPGSYKHYGFCCSDHIVDVASVDEPRIKLIYI